MRVVPCATLLFVCAAIADAPGPSAEDLAARVQPPNGWEAQPAVVYPADRVYEKINGRDQTYLGFGLVCMANVIFDSPDGTDAVDLEIYDMGAPERALGVFAQQHRGPNAEYRDIGGAEGINLAVQLVCWKDRFYIKIDRLSRRAATADEGALLLEVAEQVCKAITDAPTAASLMAPLPDETRVGHTEAYTMDSFMGYADLDDVRHARYASDDREVTLFALHPDDAQAVLESVADAEPGARPLTGIGDEGIAFVRKYMGAVCLVRAGGYVIGSVDEGESGDPPEALRQLATSLLQ